MSDTSGNGIEQCPACGHHRFDIEYTHTEGWQVSELWTCRGCGEQYGDTDADREGQR